VHFTVTSIQQMFVSLGCNGFTVAQSPQWNIWNGCILWSLYIHFCSSWVSWPSGLV